MEKLDQTPSPEFITKGAQLLTKFEAIEMSGGELWKTEDNDKET